MCLVWPEEVNSYVSLPIIGIIGKRKDAIMYVVTVLLGEYSNGLGMRIAIKPK